MMTLVNYFETGQHIIKSTFFIECLNCDETEEFPSDMQRHHSQNFEWVKNKGNFAEYKCQCGEYVTSAIIQEEECPNTFKPIERRYESQAISEKPAITNIDNDTLSNHDAQILTTPPPKCLFRNTLNTPFPKLFCIRSNKASRTNKGNLDD